MFTPPLNQDDLNKVKQLLVALNNKLPLSVDASIAPFSTTFETTIEITGKRARTKDYYTIFKTPQGVTYLRTFIAG